MYTVKELIALLKDYPSNLIVQLEQTDGAQHEEFHIEQVGKRLVMFLEGEPIF